MLPKRVEQFVMRKTMERNGPRSRQPMRVPEKVIRDLCDHKPDTKAMDGICRELEREWDVIVLRY